jgi:hypothetical protein
MVYQGWVCERCERARRHRNEIWDCPGCGHETCENCFSVLAHCRPCCEDKTYEQLRRAANNKGWDFERLPDDDAVDPVDELAERDPSTRDERNHHSSTGETAAPETK